MAPTFRFARPQHSPTRHQGSTDRKRRRTRPVSSGRSWAVGALLASAAIGGRLAVPVEAAERGPIFERRAVLPSSSPWESPEEVFAALYLGDVLDGLRSDLPQLAAPQTPRQDPPVLNFDIPPGPIASALHLFTTLTGVEVRIDPALLENRTSAGVTGVLTIEQALVRLLDGTQLAHRFLNPRLVALELRIVGESVEVRDVLPSVPSPKFTAPLLDTPQTVTVVPAAVIQNQGATTLRDVLRNVPGITMQAGEGGGGLPGDTMTLRGFAATNDIFVDGVRDVGPYARDAFNLEQVEVIKGPSSSFGGRGSTGGVINLTTKTPGFESIRQGTIGIGSAGYHRSTVDLNERVGDAAAVRINAMWQDAGVAGRRDINNRGWALAPSLALGLGRPTSLTVGYQHLSQDNVPDYGLPWGASTDPATGVAYPTGAFNADPPIAQDNFYGLRDYDFEDITGDAGTATVEHLLGDGFTLRNVTRAGRTERDSAITAPRPPNRQLQRRQMRNTTLANQVNLTGPLSTGALRHTISAGIDAARETTFSQNSAQATNQPPTNIRTPDPSDRPFGPMPAITGNPSDAVTGTVGAYLFDTIALSDRVELTGGLRWDRSHVDYELTTRSTGDVTALSRTDSMLSWRGGVVYKPRPNGSIYLGAGTAFTPAADAVNTGTALSDSDTAPNNVRLEPEKSRQVEAGTKWALFGDRLSVTGAVFQTEKTNARTRGLNNEPFVLAGRQRVRGLELGASGELAPGWMAFAAYTLMDSEIVASANDAEEGRDLTLTPRQSASVWLTGTVWRGVTIGGGAQFMDGVFRNTTTDLSVPSYWLVNAMASYAVNSHLSLRLNGTNLADTQYVDRVGGGHYIPGSRRSVQLTTDLEF